MLTDPLPRFWSGQPYLNAQEMNALSAIAAVFRNSTVVGRFSYFGVHGAINKAQRYQPKPRLEPLVVYFVKLRFAGGFPGDLSSGCTYSYDIFAETADLSRDDPVAVDLVPKFNRLAIGRYDAAANESLGMARINTQGEWELLIAFNERPHVEVCG